jgi:hypothetical protein
LGDNRRRKPEIAGTNLARHTHMKRFNSLLAVLALLAVSNLSFAVAQQQPTATEIRKLIAQSRSKDFKASDNARDAYLNWIENRYPLW